MTTTQHRCVSSGETIELAARWDTDAQWYVCYHKACDETCVSYTEEDEL